MKVSVFGLGYVGAVSCACLPELGHQVVGVDINPLKVDLIASGQSPVVEEGIEEMIANAVKAGTLTATLDVAAAVRETEISLISVATPALSNFMPDLTALDAVVGQIGQRALGPGMGVIEAANDVQGGVHAGLRPGAAGIMGGHPPRRESYTESWMRSLPSPARTVTPARACPGP